MNPLLKSKGIKRLIASLLAILTSLAMFIPGLGPVVTWLQQAAGVVGTVGVVHATAAGTLNITPLGGISSVLSMLILLANFVPSLQKYIPLLQQLAAYFGVAMVAIKVTSK